MRELRLLYQFHLQYLVRLKTSTGRNQINIFEVKKVVRYHPECNKALVTLLFAATPTWRDRTVTNIERQPFLPLNFHGSKAISATQSMLVYPMDFIPGFHFPSAFLCSI